MRRNLPALMCLSMFAVAICVAACAQEKKPPRRPRQVDAVQEAQTPRKVDDKRPEQQKTDHEKSDAFKAA